MHVLADALPGISCRYSLKDVHVVSSGLWHTLPLDILAESMQQVGGGVLKVMGAVQFEGREPKPPGIGPCQELYIPELSTWCDVLTIVPLGACLAKPGIVYLETGSLLFA
jgi:hypothetical protein